MIREAKLDISRAISAPMSNVKSLQLEVAKTAFFMQFKM